MCLLWIYPVRCHSHLFPDAFKIIFLSYMKLALIFKGGNFEVFEVFKKTERLEVDKFFDLIYNLVILGVASPWTPFVLFLPLLSATFSTNAQSS